MSYRTVTFLQDTELHLEGHPIAVGDEAREATLSDGLATSYNLLADSAGFIRLVSVVPSLDTGVCDAQTRRFNEEAAALGPDVKVLAVSADLPTAQERWCGASGAENIKVLSDHKEMNFAHAYGTWVKELRLNHRAVFVIDQKDKVTYVQYLDELTDHPDYDRALAAVKELQ